MSVDVQSRREQRQAIVPAPLSSTSDVNHEAVNVSGFAGSMFEVDPDTVSQGNPVPKLQHSHDGVVWDDVPADEQQGTFQPLVSNTPQKVGYKNTRRLARLVTQVGATSLLAATYDGDRYAAPGTLTNGKKFTISFWTRFGGVDTDNGTFFAVDGITFSFNRIGEGVTPGRGTHLQISATDTGLTNNLLIQTKVQDDFRFVSGGGWVHIAVAVDMDDNRLTRVYVDGERLDIAQPAFTQGSAIALDNAAPWIGGLFIFFTETDQFLGDLAEMWGNFSEYVDLDTDITKFRSLDGQAVSLGAAGATPTGTSPEVYIPTGAPTTNAGTLGNFTLVGGTPGDGIAVIAGLSDVTISHLEGYGDLVNPGLVGAFDLLTGNTPVLQGPISLQAPQPDLLYSETPDILSDKPDLVSLDATTWKVLGVQVGDWVNFVGTAMFRVSKYLACALDGEVMRVAPPGVQFELLTATTATLEVYYDALADLGLLQAAVAMAEGNSQTEYVLTGAETWSGLGVAVGDIIRFENSATFATPVNGDYRVTSIDITDKNITFKGGVTPAAADAGTADIRLIKQPLVGC